MRFRAAGRPARYHLADDTVSVANQGSGTITVLPIELGTVSLSSGVGSLNVQSPTCLLTGASTGPEAHSREERQ